MGRDEDLPCWGLLRGGRERCGEESGEGERGCWGAGDFKVVGLGEEDAELGVGRGWLAGRWW